MFGHEYLKNDYATISRALDRLIDALFQALKKVNYDEYINEMKFALSCINSGSNPRCIPRVTGVNWVDQRLYTVYHHISHCESRLTATLEEGVRKRIALLARAIKMAQTRFAKEQSKKPRPNCIDAEWRG